MKRKLLGLLMAAALFAVQPAGMAEQAASTLYDGLQIVQEEGKYGYADSQGDILIPPEYDEAREFQPDGSGFAAVKKDGRWGYMEYPLLAANQDGSPIVHWIDGADQLGDFHDGYALVFYSTSFSLINTQFEEVLGGPYDYIEQYEQYFLLSQQGKKGVFQYDGTPILPLEYDEIHTEEMESGVFRFRVQKDGKYGLYNLDGSEVLPCVYDDLQLSPNATDVLVAAKDGRYGILALTEERVPFIYDEIQLDGDGYLIKLDGKYGLLRADFSQLVPPVYDEIGSLYTQDTPRPVKRDGLYGYIDVNGTEVIPPQFDAAFWFRNGVAVVQQNGKYGCINARGQFVIPPEYDRIEIPVGGEAYMEKDGVQMPFVNPMSLDSNVPDAGNYMVLQIGTYAMYTGAYVDLDAAPVLLEDRTFVPMRAIVEQLGGTADWQADTQTALFTWNGTTVSLQIGSDTATVNGEARPLDAAPWIENDRTMLPLRFIMENLGTEVSWDGLTQKITITY